MINPPLALVIVPAVFIYVSQLRQDADELFLDEQISLVQVAEKLDVQSRHLSQMVNTKFRENFSAFVNTRRVQEAAARLCSEKYGKLPITTIMYDTGFSSKSAFNREFKRHFCVSPKEYREKQRQ